jgi:hypothetical protein
MTPVSDAEVFRPIRDRMILALSAKDAGRAVEVDLSDEAWAGVISLLFRGLPEPVRAAVIAAVGGLDAEAVSA